MKPGAFDRTAWMPAIFSAVFLGAAALLLFATPREAFPQLIGLYAVCFAAYLFLVRKSAIHEKHRLIWLIGLAIAARIMASIALPQWSDDVYRYLWDGQLWLAGLHPFDGSPAHWIDSGILPDGGLWDQLFPLLNSQDYQTVYPPVHQVVFYFAAIVAPNDIITGIYVIKAFVLAAELVNLSLLYQLGREKGLRSDAVFWYGLNPLVIAEGCGNLHLEVVMITFLLLSLRALSRSEYLRGGMAFAGAILTKLHPLLLLPFAVKYIRSRGAFVFAGTAVLVTLLAFLMLWWPPAQLATRAENLHESLMLYVQNFEFNAGIYYLLRSIGWKLAGYNAIHWIGRLLALATLALLGLILWRQREGLAPLVRSIFLAYLTYYLLSTTVHPWYILTMLPFAVLTGYRSPVLWTGLIIVSYAAYGGAGWHENFYLLALEYTCIFAFLIYEFRREYHR